MKKLLLLISITSIIPLSAQDTLSVMAYNILNYPASNSTKADTLKAIVKHVEPDIFMITELTASSGVSTILNDALNVDGITHFQNATYNNGPDTDNMLFYNSDKLVLYSQHEIPTALRNISEYVLYYDSPGLTAASDTVFIYCYMAHLKASSGATNEQKRNQEAISLKNYMSTRTNIENVILGGDFNLYTSAEAAWNTILNAGNVQLLDPISSPGAWNNNAAFANIHTQSTRSGTIGDGGAFGGMDDRFDFIFFNNDLPTGANGLTYVPGSYTALGNDGNHFNKSINDSPTNSSAPSNVIDALYYMSDHLPITIKAYVVANVGIEEDTSTKNWTGFQENNLFKFIASQEESTLNFEVFDLLGKLVLNKKVHNQKEVSLQLSGLKKSLYVVSVSTPNHQKSFKVFVR